jgi:hypothetical protein
MMKHKLQARLGATAIAAALALSSTPLLAQQATPDTTQTAPSTAPATDSAPATDTTPTVAVPDISTATPDTSPSTTDSTTTTSRTTVRHSVASTARPAPARTVATHHATPPPPAAAAPAVTPVATAPATTTAPAPPAGPPPLAQIAGPPPAAANTNQQTPSNRTSEIVGAAIFLLIVLGAIAYALSRRRRTRETVYEEEAYEPETAYAEPEPVHAHTPIAEEQPAIVAPEASAFAWGDRPQAGHLETPAAAREAEEEQPSTLPSGFDLSRFGPHVQAAYRGPTPDNPSLSLRNRLRRAAAMDQKERAMGVAASDAPMNGETVIERGELTDA